MNPAEIQGQIDSNRRTVGFDNYDITVQQVYHMITNGSIDIAPEYQRHFAWDGARQSQLIESLFLGIPVPSLFFATNADATWEVVDGLQRLTTIVNFVANEDQIKKVNSDCVKLKIESLEKLSALNGLKFEQLPQSVQLMFMTRPLRVTVLNDRSDFKVRYDLFERLNTGGISLHPQEIRNCIYLGAFNTFLKECVRNDDFKTVVKMTEKAELSGNLEELVLKFFAYLECREEFVHSVKGFLNDYMFSKTTRFKNEDELRSIFNKTFDFLNSHLPDGIVRGSRKNITPLVLYEAIAVGAADAILSGRKIFHKRLVALLNDSNLRNLTTGATNSRTKLVERIEYVSNALTK
jgi:uncharacterized protein with ParB-like and HNH nuclease domain